jgi:hypothetical protein
MQIYLPRTLQFAVWLELSQLPFELKFVLIQTHSSSAE